MRIVISINTSWNIYNFRSGLIKGLQKEGHEIVAVAPLDEYSEKLEKELGVKHFPILIDNKGSNPLKDIKLMFEYKKLFNQIKPDAILQFTIKPNIYGTIAAKILKIPTINNVSGLGTIFINPNTITSKIGMILYKYAFRFPKKVFFQNNDDKELFINHKLVNNNITGILPGSGVDLDKFMYSPKAKEEKFIFLMIARVLYDKGIVEYVIAAKEILSKHKNIEFQILGNHDESKGSVPKNALKKWVDDGTINYLGTTDDVASVIRSSDCVVLPSYREGTPKTLLEALAIGRPIITTDVAGCKETVINNENGYLCDVKSANDLAKKIDSMISLSDDERFKMSEKSRKLAESKFDEQLVIQKYISEINGI